MNLITHYIYETFDNEDAGEVTLLDIKKNFSNYSKKRLRSQASVLIDSLCDLTNVKDLWNENLDMYGSEKLFQVIKISDLGE